MLLNQLNTTDQILIRNSRHINFITDIKTPTCGYVISLPPEERCDYVAGAEQCHEDEFIFSYIDFFYCTLDSSKMWSKIIGEICLLVVSMFLFLILGTTSSLFFCPALKVISDILSLNENVAGVTLLAFGNCAPDVMTGFSGMGSDNRVIYTDFMGSIMFVVFFVGGLIITVCPCVVVGSIFLRDLLFLLLALNYVHVVYDTDYSVNLGESIGIVTIYLFYIVAVVSDQILSQKAVEKQTEQEQYNRRTTTENVGGGDVSVTSSSQVTTQEKEQNDNNRPNIAEQPPSQTPKKTKTSCGRAIKEILWQFINSINPIPVVDWIYGSTFDRIFLIIKSPVVFCLQLLIPLVDFDSEGHGWSRLLNCLQVVILPTFIVFTTAPATEIFGFPLYQLTPMVLIPIALIIFFITTHRKIPKYHQYFAILATMGSMYIIYCCAQEIVSILTVVGITTNCSSSFLGCTLLAWGNSLGDLVVNVTLARQGYEKMSLSACFGGPLFNVLIGIGLSTVFRASNSPGLKTSVYNFGQGLVGLNINLQMVIGLVILAFGTSFTNFVLRRAIGIYMILIYIIFFIMAVLMEMELVHPYGCDHRLEEEVDAAYDF